LPLIPSYPNETIIVQDGGNLLCNVIENPCTSYTKVTKADQLCNPTTDSNVPGNIEYLCWNNGLQTLNSTGLHYLIQQIATTHLYNLPLEQLLIQVIICL
jgi:hypothetical protein